MDLKIENAIRESCPECGPSVFPLKHLLEHAEFDRSGIVIELGVASGNSINMMGRSMPHNKNIYGFDCFEGLPETWDDGWTKYQVGAFSTGGSLPRVTPNITLIKGMFADTLPEFQRAVLGESPIALLHVDCDIYSAAKCGFDALKPNIVEGTIVLFDELWNYPDYRQHEIKAFAEFLEETGLWIEPLLCRQRKYTLYHNKEVAVRIRA